MSESCPSREELSDFLVGNLPDRQFDTVDSHVDQCSLCQETVQNLDSTLNSPLELNHELPNDNTVSSLIAELEELPHRANQPEQIGPYQLKRMLGEGGMGKVYLAKQIRLNRNVALKVLPRNRTDSPEFVARFQREMELIGPLEHENVVRAFDADERDGVHFIAMEYVQGRSLSDLVRIYGPLAIPDACELARQVACGLEYIHQQGLVHRDIKPANLILSNEGVVKILDLGIALLKDHGEGTELTSTNQIMGTLDYIAPEQAQNSHDVDIRADIYSLGATLVKLLTGKSYFAKTDYDSGPGKIQWLMGAGGNRSLAREYSAELSEIFAKTLVREPRKRFSSPGELARALEPLARDAILARLDRPFAPTIANTPHVDRQKTGGKQGSGIWRVALVVFLLISCAALIWSSRWTKQTPAKEPDVDQGASTASLSPRQFAFSNILLHEQSDSHLSRLGHAIASQGDVIVVGAPDAFGTAARTGAAYVLKMKGDTSHRLELVRTLLPPNRLGEETIFGQAVATDGTRILVGGQGRRNLGGVAIVYAKHDGKWEFEAELKSPEPGMMQFGDSLSISGDYAFVQAAHGRQRVVCIYQETSRNWKYLTTISPDNQLEPILPSMKSNNGRLGLVESVRQDTAQGTVYRFRVKTFVDVPDAGWQHEATIDLPDEATSGHVPPQIALANDLLAVSVPRATIETTIDAGVVRIYAFSGKEWNETQRVTSESPFPHENFGTSLAVTDDTMLVGSSRTKHDGIGGGAVFLYRLRDGRWNPEGILQASKREAKSNYGLTTALLGEKLALVGDSVGNSLMGCVHSFLLGPDTAAQAVVWSQAKSKPVLVENNLLGFLYLRRMKRSSQPSQMRMLGVCQTLV